MLLDVRNIEYKDLNEKIRLADRDVKLTGCCGQRFIGAGMQRKNIVIEGVPGNSLGAYLDGAVIEVMNNVQDAVGDTMNDGRIIVHGDIGDAAGYAMRGGKIYIQGDAGYRAGIHMKAYKDKVPVMIIGGSVGSFLGEYQAGGIIIVLGMNSRKRKIAGNFPCTGMHGGKAYFRGDVSNIRFPDNVCVAPATEEDMEVIKRELTEYCSALGLNADEILDAPFTTVSPDSRNPYKQMYIQN